MNPTSLLSMRIVWGWKHAGWRQSVMVTSGEGDGCPHAPSIMLAALGSLSRSWCPKNCQQWANITINRLLTPTPNWHI